MACPLAIHRTKVVFNDCLCVDPPDDDDIEGRLNEAYNAVVTTIAGLNETVKKFGFILTIEE